MKLERINLDETKKVMLSIMEYFDDFCRQNGLKMWLYAGTLLGAVRHKGYIPWDDDIDVCMTREDYDKLLTLIDKIDPKYMLLEHSLNKKYKYPFAKLTLKDSLCVEFHNPKFCGVKLGIYIDIFPIDYVGDTLEVANKHCEETNKMVWYSMQYLRHPITGNFFKRCVRLFKRVFVFNGLFANAYLSKFNKKLRTFKEPTKYSAVPVWVNANKTILETSDYRDDTELTFEGKKFYSFKGYIRFLEKLFGNYMELPPIEQREVHGSETYLLKNETTAENK